MAHLQASLPIPSFVNLSHANDARFAVKNLNALHKRALEWRAENRLTPAGADAVRVQLLVIDDQADFSFPAGALYVAGRSGTGAMDAQRNLAAFVHRRLNVISEITCTMDTHAPYQVFFTSAHVRRDGSHPEPHTVISAAEYRNGDYEPNPAMARHLGADIGWLRRQWTHYCESLEATGKYQLHLWPYHCVLGTDGHRLAGIVDEARLFHAFARSAANVPELKGDSPLTERYSIFSAEITKCWDGAPIPGAQKNERLLNALLASDVIVIAGLASSHCVQSSVADLLTEIQARDARLAQKVYILRDCTAAVVTPGADFTDAAEQAMRKFEDAGMRVVSSTDDMESWPGILEIFHGK
jgi:nicotinamidase-related amidase